MSTSSNDNDLIFRILCARALQRHGEGFPSTDEEIAKFEASYTPTAQEEAFAGTLEGIIEKAAAQVAGNTEAKPGSPAIIESSAFERLKQRRVEERRAAARGIEGEKLSDELSEKIDRLIEEESGEKPEHEDGEDKGGKQG